MTKKRSSLAKVGTIFLALIVALALTGMGYGIWSDVLIINATVETGTVSANVSCDGCSPEPSSDNTSISCNIANNVLEVDVTNAQVGTGYYCDFSIENTGSIPFKIESILVSPLPPAPDVVVEINNDVAEDVQIDPGITKDGTVDVSLSDNTSQGEDFDFTVTFEVVQWNQ